MARFSLFVVLPIFISTTAVTPSFAGEQLPFDDPPLLVPVTAGGIAARSMEVGDLNGDSWLDIVVVKETSGDNTLIVYWGSESGDYSSSDEFELVEDLGDGGDLWGTNDFEIGDVNGDGYDDLVSEKSGVNRPNLSVILCGPSGPQLEEVPVAVGPGNVYATELRLADLDGDGALDAIFETIGPGAVFDLGFMLGNGDGTFGPLEYLEHEGNIEGYAVGDVTGDGRLDVVGIRNGPIYRALTTFVQSGDGAFLASESALPQETDPVAIALADTDGDGRIDAGLALNMAIGGGPGSIALAFGDSLGGFGGYITFSKPFSRAADGDGIDAADIDGDRRADFVSRLYYGEPSSDARIFRSDGAGVLNGPDVLASDTGLLTDIALRDLNRDFAPDLVVMRELPPEIRVYYNQLGPFCPADILVDGQVDAGDLAIVLAQWGQPGVADLTGDGEVDSADLATVLAAWGPCP